MEPEYFLQPDGYLSKSAIGDGYLFPGRTSGHISSMRIQIRLNLPAEKAGLQMTRYVDRAGRNRRRVTPHLPRHSFAVWSLDCGLPICNLKEQLGHSAFISTTVYIQAMTHCRSDSCLLSGFEGKSVPAELLRR